MSTSGRSSFVFVPLSKEYESLIISFGKTKIDTLKILDKTFSKGDDCCESVFLDYTLTLEENLICMNCEYLVWQIKNDLIPFNRVNSFR